jgi:hypothetical protein
MVTFGRPFTAQAIDRFERDPCRYRTDGDSSRTRITGFKASTDEQNTPSQKMRQISFKHRQRDRYLYRTLQGISPPPLSPPPSPRGIIIVYSMTGSAREEN